MPRGDGTGPVGLGPRRLIRVKDMIRKRLRNKRNAPGVPDGTGPHGRGLGPGKVGVANRLLLKKKIKKKKIKSKSPWPVLLFMHS